MPKINPTKNMVWRRTIERICDFVCVCEGGNKGEPNSDDSNDAK